MSEVDNGAVSEASLTGDGSSGGTGLLCFGLTMELVVVVGAGSEISLTGVGGGTTIVVLLAHFSIRL